MDTKTRCRDTVLALALHECRVSVLEGCSAVNKSPKQHVIVMNASSVEKFNENKISVKTFSLSLPLSLWCVLYLSLGYWVSQQISDQPGSRATTEVRGQIKKVSWRQTRLPSEVFPPNGIKSLLTAASTHHAEPLPSLASSCNC